MAFQSGDKLNEILRQWWLIYLTHDERERASGAAHALGITLAIYGFSSWIRSIHTRRRQELSQKLPSQDFAQYCDFCASRFNRKLLDPKQL